MRKVYLVLLIALPFLSFSQQQLNIKGIHPNFYVMHNVTANETYASIAKLYNIPPTQLANYNDLTLHNGKIFARTLRIPLVTQNFTQKMISANELLVPINYVFSAQEKVSNVSAKFRVPLVTLKQINNLTDQQLYSSIQLIVGYLKIRPEASSFFGVTKKATDVANTKPSEQIKRPVPSAADEQKVPNGVRLPKKRGDEVAVVEPKTEVQPDTTAVAPTTAIEDTKLPAAARSKRVKVFLDCSNTWCDGTFIRTEINIVDFLLDRVASDVHMLITSQQNGNGGSQFQMIFYGQNKFKNLKDTLRFNLDPNATDVERRDAMLRYIKFGLTPYIAKTDYANEIDIQMKKTEQAQGEVSSNTDTKDKWNYWVFRAGADGNLSLDQVYKSSSYSGNFSANRTTDKIKLALNAYGSQNVSKYEYDNLGVIEKFTVKNSSYEVEHTLVRSISEHWSLGYEAEYTNSTFSNNKGRLYFSPAIEYAIFPYKEVNNKYFTVSYGVDVRRNTYYDTTIYDKTEETLYGHNLTANLSLNQKWGSIYSSLSYRNFFHDWNLTNLGMNLSINVRISGGLSVNGYTYGGLTRDQLYLPKGGATEQEILTRRRQLASGYNFYSGFGLNYRFGSKLNNFINPRFNARY